jgi:hypothetical protein
MQRRKAAVVALLLQGLTALQIASHSRFAAARGFSAGPLGFGFFISTMDCQLAKIDRLAKICRRIVFS